MTINFYQTNARQFFESTVNVDMSSLYAAFTEQLAPNARVLDAGCGSGRDSKAFREMGYQVEAFDASSEMVTLASQHAAVPVRQLSFHELTDTGRYQGIWCCASLLHLPASQLPDAMQKLARALTPGGIWYVSFKYGDSERVKEGRHFTDLNERTFSNLIQQLPGIHIQSTWLTEDKRPDRNETWLNALLRKA
ncbi:class I SAM-dependent methyltransferase [Scandinavium manionii]|uniref:class I SAM-dependent methyltransferase n=1 Tax=Scandinavium manionii TaxID=2926520 RepID=UPI0021652185|nr:class I SAM-dependent methyltransferase [Scandinavium manionii]MCS2149328.1 class I SAM-dependent methyltransferase [Scandinavium manionii]